MLSNLVTAAGTNADALEYYENAMWFAGQFYGFSGLSQDLGPEIMKCYVPIEGLHDMIDDGMKKLQVHDWMGAYKAYANWAFIGRYDALLNQCDCYPKFQKLNKAAMAFKERADSEEIMKKNYVQHKGFIDMTYSKAIDAWLKSDYFVTGTALAENLKVLTQVPQDDVQIAPVFMGAIPADEPVVEDAAAEWVAGYLYGITGRVTDMRDATVACFIPQDGLVDLIDQGMEKMAAGDYKGMSEVYTSTEYQTSMTAGMAACDEVNAAYAPINQYAQDFYAREDAKDLLKSNYESHKDFIDLEAQRAVTSWTLGVYYNAAMFIGEDVATLTLVPQ